MTYRDYTRETPGRFVMPDVPTGIVPYHPPVGSLYDSSPGPYAPRYRNPCDRLIGSSIGYPGAGYPHAPVVGGIHPRNWDLFEYPTGPRVDRCPPPGPMYTPFGPVPEWGRRRGLPAPSVIAEGFEPRPGGLLVPPWVAPAGNPIVTREHPHEYGKLNPYVWPAPGTAEASYAYGTDPRPLFYGPQAPHGGMPENHGPFYPRLRTEHARSPRVRGVAAPEDPEPPSGNARSTAPSGNTKIPPHLVFVFVFVVLLACMLNGGMPKTPALGAAMPGPAVGIIPAGSSAT
jgi:hypothetical protein